jgi:hypothetical protein
MLAWVVVAPAGVEPAHADSKHERRNFDLQRKAPRWEARAPVCAPFPRRGLSDAHRLQRDMPVKTRARGASASHAPPGWS